MIWTHKTVIVRNSWISGKYEKKEKDHVPCHHMQCSFVWTIINKRHFDFQKFRTKTITKVFIDILVSVTSNIRSFALPKLQNWNWGVSVTWLTETKLQNYRWKLDSTDFISKHMTASYLWIFFSVFPESQQKLCQCTMSTIVSGTMFT